MYIKFLLLSFVAVNLLGECSCQYGDHIQEISKDALDVAGIKDVDPTDVATVVEGAVKDTLNDLGITDADGDMHMSDLANLFGLDVNDVDVRDLNPILDTVNEVQPIANNENDQITDQVRTAYDDVDPRRGGVDPGRTEMEARVEELQMAFEDQGVRIADQEAEDVVRALDRPGVEGVNVTLPDGGEFNVTDDDGDGDLDLDSGHDPDFGTPIDMG